MMWLFRRKRDVKAENDAFALGLDMGFKMGWEKARDHFAERAKISGVNIIWCNDEMELAAFDNQREVKH